MIALLVLLISCAGGVIYFGNSTLRHESKKLVSLKLQNNATNLQQVTLAKAQKELQQYQSLGQEVTAIVPQDKDQAQAVREIVQIANTSGISLDTITFPTSNLGTVSALASNSTALAVSQATLVPGIPGVYSINMTIQPDQHATYTYNQIIQFLKRLENNRRTAQVSEIQISPDSNNITRLHFSLQVTIYIKP